MALPRINTYPLPQASQLPEPRVSWQPETGRLALLVHDMQRYFCTAFQPDADPFRPLVSNICRLIEAARSSGIPVFYTAQKGNQFLPDRGLQADFWGAGMSAKPEHEEILPELAPQDGDPLLVKHRYSAFQRSNLAELMRARGRDQLMITGIYAHIGCLATAVEAFQRDIQPFAIADAQADFSESRHSMAMDWIAACCGVPFSTEAAIRAIATCN